MNPDQTPSTPLMTAAEAAQLLGIEVETLYQWRHRRYGPPVAKVGRVLRYRRDDLDAWLAARTEQYDPAPEPAA